MVIRPCPYTTADCQSSPVVQKHNRVYWPAGNFATSDKYICYGGGGYLSCAEDKKNGGRITNNPPDKKTEFTIGHAVTTGVPVYNASRVTHFHAESHS